MYVYSRKKWFIRNPEVVLYFIIKSITVYIYIFIITAQSKTFNTDRVMQQGLTLDKYIPDIEYILGNIYI